MLGLMTDESEANGSAICLARQQTRPSATHEFSRPRPIGTEGSALNADASRPRCNAADLTGLDFGEVLWVDDSQHWLDLAGLSDRLRRGSRPARIDGEPGATLALLALRPVKAVLVVNAATAAREAARLLAGLVRSVALWARGGKGRRVRATDVDGRQAAEKDALSPHQEKRPE